MGKFELGCAAWVDQVRRLLDEALSAEDLVGVTASFCEEYTNAPEHLRPPGEDAVGWHLRIADGSISVEPRVLRDADLRVTADYETIRGLAKLPPTP